MAPQRAVNLAPFNWQLSVNPVDMGLNAGAAQLSAGREYSIRLSWRQARSLCLSTSSHYYCALSKAEAQENRGNIRVYDPCHRHFEIYFTLLRRNENISTKVLSARNGSRLRRIAYPGRSAILPADCAFYSADIPCLFGAHARRYGSDRGHRGVSGAPGRAHADIPGGPASRPERSGDHPRCAGVRQRARWRRRKRSAPTRSLRPTHG